MAISGLIYLIVWLAVIGLILWVVWWGITQIPMPEPISTVVRVIFVLIVCIVAITFLLQILPGGPDPIRLPGRL